MCRGRSCTCSTPQSLRSEAAGGGGGDIEVPTANPLQPNAETTYVSLVPGIPADANSVFSIMATGGRHHAGVPQRQAAGSRFVVNLAFFVSYVAAAATRGCC